MNNLNIKLEKYKKELDYSYTLGVFPTFELLKNQAQNVFYIAYSSKLKITTEIENLLNLAKNLKIDCEINDKLINKLSEKENCFIIAFF